MFRSKRNFSILSSPGEKRAATNQPQTSSVLNGQSPSCNKRMRLSSTLRTSSTLAETRAESIERSPILRGNNDGNGLTLTERFTKATSLMAFQSNLPGLNGFVGGNNKQVVINGEHATEASGSTFELASANNCQTLELANDKEKVLEKVETPPPSPVVTKLESRVDNLNREISQLRVELNDLDVQIEAKFLSITTTHRESVKLKYKNLVVEDLFNVANGSLTEVRDLLNQIYNPAQDLEKKLRLLMEDSNRRHANKLEKVNFELNNLLETSEEAVRNKAKQLEHEISLQERVLITIECQKRHELSKERDPIEMEIEDPSGKKEEERNKANDGDNEKAADMSEQEATTEVRVDDDSMDGADDECVIIDENQEICAESNTVEVGNPVRTPEPQTTDESGRDNDSATTIPFVDEEETDIEESKTDDDEDRCFTPCQAQKPK